MAPVRAQSVAEWYVFAKNYETKLPEYRKILKAGKSGSALRKAVDALIAELPDSDVIPPFTQMRSLYCYGDPAANRNEKGDKQELEEQFRREDQWGAQLSPTVVKAVLVRWREQMDTLLSATGKGRTEIAAERSFVKSLARYWTEELEVPLRLSRGDGGYGEKAGKQSGPFSDFVK